MTHTIKRLTFTFTFIVSVLCCVGLVRGSNKRMERGNQPSGTQAMTETMTKGDSDLHFLTEMIKHHQDAINRSKDEIEKGTNQKVKQFAHQMSNNQTAEIQEMLGIRERLPKDSSMNGEAYENYLRNYEAIKKQFMEAMQAIKPTSNEDKDFLNHMKVHHQEGIEMSKNVLKYTKSQEVKAIANRTIKEQLADITLMDALLHQVE